MIKICFVCLGNICRSPMAEFIMKDLVNKKGLSKDFFIASKGISDEEVGNDMHSGTKNVLDKNNIPYEGHYATKLLKNDYDKYDYFIGMDDYNILSMKRLFGTDKKIYKLLDFTKDKREIDDPWYTHNFLITYSDIYNGCKALFDFLCKDK